MTKIFSSPLLLATGFGLVLALACSGGSSTSSTTPPPAPPAPPTAPVVQPTEPTVAPAAASIGVPECDKYLSDFEACVNKVPPEAKASMQASLQATRSAWQQAASTPAGKDALVTSCNAMVMPPVCGGTTGAATPTPAPGVTPGTVTTTTTTVVTTTAKPGDVKATETTKPAEKTTEPALRDRSHDPTSTTGFHAGGGNTRTENNNRPNTGNNNNNNNNNNGGGGFHAGHH